MKRTMLVAGTIGVGILIAVGFYTRQPQPQPAAATEVMADPTSANDFQPVASAAAQTEPSVTAEGSTAKPVSIPVAPPARSRLDAALVSRAVELITSPQVTLAQKAEAWKKLREAGKLDQAITELEQLTVSDPRNAEYPAALGQAYLKKCGTIQDTREQGILAMQADKLFDSSLSLDPANWEARFTKAVALTYWPASLNKGEEAILHFQTLIQQQESQPSQPEFAGPYTWLGEQYQKAGRTEEARTVWQRGAALFPADEQLRSKLVANP